MTRRTSLALALAVLLPAAAARANGAFPDTLGVVLPADRPDTLVLGTNFGLVSSTDGGATWRWSCEHDESIDGLAYQAAAPPSRRIFTLAGNGFAFTDDLGCAWSASPGLRETFPYDYFPDPGDGNRVLALTSVVGPTGVASVLVESTDGGSSFGPPLYQAEPGHSLTSVEVARSDPRFVYVTVARSGRTVHTWIARSQDGGKTWTRNDPGDVIGPTDLRLAAVDAEDPQRLHLRAVGEGKDGLALSEDGGASARPVLVADGFLRGFVRLGDGTLLASADREQKGRLYRSRDRGASYAEVPITIHPRALGGRGRRAYAATDNQADGFALAMSDDGGDTWSPVMKLADVRDVVSCPGLVAKCLPICTVVAGTQTFPPALCEALAAPKPEPRPLEEDCSCRLGGRERSGGGLAALLGLALVAISRRPRRR